MRLASRTMLLAAAALGLLAPSFDLARAQDCNPRSGSAVSGTLIDPRAPCRPAARERPDERPSRSERERGTYRNGNTTIHIGGSISGETTIRGR